MSLRFAEVRPVRRRAAALLLGALAAVRAQRSGRIRRSGAQNLRALMHEEWLEARCLEFDFHDLVDAGTWIFALSGRLEALVIIEASGAVTATPFGALEALGISGKDAGAIFPLGGPDRSGDSRKASRFGAALRDRLAREACAPSDMCAISRFWTVPMSDCDESWFTTMFG